MTSLKQLLVSLPDLDDDLTIYSTREATAGSPAVAALEPDSGDLPKSAEGLDYLLEVSLAKEVAEVWRSWRDGREPSPEELCEAVIFYAENDAFIPVEGSV